MRLSSGNSRPKKPRPPPSFTPWPCVIIAVDTAERSGWAVYVSGELVSSGEVDMLDPSKSTDSEGVSGWNADRVCLHAFWEVAENDSLPVVLVYERPFRGTTQGQYIGAWKAAFLRGGGRKSRMLGVYPATWRSRVLSAGSASRETARLAEQRRAEREARHAVGPDEAAAVCIGLWSRCAGEVGAVIPKPKRPKKVPPPRPARLSKLTPRSPALV